MILLLLYQNYYCYNKFYIKWIILKKNIYIQNDQYNHKTNKIIRHNNVALIYKNMQKSALFFYDEKIYTYHGLNTSSFRKKNLSLFPMSLLRFVAIHVFKKNWWSMQLRNGKPVEKNPYRIPSCNHYVCFKYI